MGTSKNTVSKNLAFWGALVAFAAVVLQLYLIILHRTESIAETIIRFFSYFTILTNTLVGICFAATYLQSNGKFMRFFSKPATLAATAVYITVVGVVYQVLLRQLWNPEGLQWLVDELLHTLIPTAFVIYRFAFVPSSSLKPSMIYSWLLYPLIYLIYILIRGHFSGFYPYPFVDVNALGYIRVIANSAVLVLVFMALSAFYMYVGKKTFKQ